MHFVRVQVSGWKPTNSFVAPTFPYLPEWEGFCTFDLTDFIAYSNQCYYVSGTQISIWHNIPYM